MEMKLEEAQICRLCGECESIYIDVFGEEGTKRFLGIKIHTKINILIDETDPLPKAICVQCLGKLEFVCDFQEECLRTQQVLRERYNLPALTDVINESDGLSHIVCIKCLGALEFLCDFHEQCHKTQVILAKAKQKSEKREDFSPTPMEISYDTDSDKENSTPKVKHGIKRKKQINPEIQKPTKIQNVMTDKSFKANVQESDPSRVEPNLKKTEDAKITKVEDSKMNDIEVSKMIKIQETRTDKIDESVIHEIAKTTINQIEETKLTTIEEIKVRNNEDVRANKTDHPKVNEFGQSDKTKINESEVNKTDQTKNTKVNEPEVNKTELSKEIKISESEVKKIKQSKETSKDEPELTKKSQTKSPRTVVPEVNQISQTKKIRIDELKSRRSEEKKDHLVQRKISDMFATPSSTRSRVSVISKLKVVEKSVTVEVEANEASDRRQCASDESNLKISEKGTIVKLEKIESMNDTGITTKEILKPNKIVWIPNMLQLPEAETLKSPCMGTVCDGTPTTSNKIAWISSTLRTSEVESPKSTRALKSHEDSPPAGDEAGAETSETIFDKRKESASMGLSAKRVHEKSHDKKRREVVVSSRAKRRENRVKKWKTSDKSENDDDEDSCSGSKKFGKITDLITSEQKDAIEKFYVCDMSAVDERMVGEQLAFLDRKKFGCKLCAASYTRQDKCQVHIWGHLDMKPYRCTACEFSTVTVSNIRCHVRKSHLKIKPYACELCNKRYVTAFLLEEHMNTHTGSRPYACGVCEFKSASRQVLSYHKTTHKPVKDITCHVCGKEFYSKGRLRAHLIIHNKDKAANMCKLCSIYLCNSEALQRHYANVHSKDYECNVCGKRCKSKKALNNHQNVHSAAKHKCTLCSNVYKSSHILKEHLLKHEGIRKYKCSVCQKDFAQQSHLAAHMAVHSDRRFCCPGCNRPFNRHDNMKMHTKRCDAFLANPELASALSTRKRHGKSPPKDTKKEIEPENDTAPSPEPEYTKTDFRAYEEDERSIETPNTPQSSDECRETFTTIIVENTIPCT